MADNSRYFAEYHFALRTFSLYARLLTSSGSALAGPTEPNLGGKLLYVGELDENGRAVAVAANIAGSASLSATSSQAAQKQAIRDGVIDFLVTSLDEALRILKNEIRKREPVAVCIAAAPDAIEMQMVERGVQPDLWRPIEAEIAALPSHADPNQGPEQSDPMRTPALVEWSVSSAPAQWLPKLDALALSCLGPDFGGARRWLRMAPRYLGRLAQGVRLVYADRELAACFVEQLRARYEQGEIAVSALVKVSSTAGPEEYHFPPKQ
jgi:Urocanase Rossmann-like domain